MLMTCAGCNEIFDGLTDHCPNCFVHGLCPTGRERSLVMALMMHVTPAQRTYTIDLLRGMSHEDLLTLFARMLQGLSPIERSDLLMVAAEIMQVAKCP